MKNKPSYVKVGRRTGESLLTGKHVRRINDGTDNFNDYWTDSSENSSSEELENSTLKSSGNDIVSFNDSSGESEGTSVQHFLTLRASPAHRKSTRKSVLNSPYATKCDAGTSSTIDNVARKSLGKRRKTFSSRSIQTSMKKKAYSREEDSSPERSVSRSPKRRLFLKKQHIQTLPHEKTMVDKSMNTSLKHRSAFQRQDTESRELPLPMQIDGTSSNEEGGESPAELTAVSSQLQIKRRLNFESPKSVKEVSKSKSFVQEKTMINKSSGFSPTSVSRKSSSPEESAVLPHIASTSFDQGNSPAKVSLKSGKGFSASKNSALEDSGMQVSVEMHNEEGVERLNFKSPKLGKRVSKSSSFIQEKTRVDESVNIASALQNRSFQLQDVNSCNVPSHVTGTPSDQEGSRSVGKILRSGKKVSASETIALEDSGMQDRVETQSRENIEGLTFSSQKSGETVSKSKSFGEKTITSKSRNSTPASVSLKSCLKQPNASSTNVPSHITGTPLDLERSGSQTSAKKSIKSGRRISSSRNSVLEDSVMLGPNASSTNVPSHITGTPLNLERSGSQTSAKKSLKSGSRISSSRNSALEDSVIQGSVGMQNEEDVERLDFFTPMSRKRISKSKSFVQEKTRVNKSTNSTPASVSRKSFQQQNSSITNVASHITSTSLDPGRSESLANAKRGHKFGGRIYPSKSLALADSVAEAQLQGHTEMQNGRVESERTKKKRIRSFVQEKTVVNKSVNSTPASVSRKSFQRQNSSFTNVSSHIIGTLSDPDVSESPANAKRGLKFGERISLSKSLALEDSVAQAELQGHMEIQNGRSESARRKQKRLHSLVLEKTVQDRSCNTSGVCTVKKNAESRENTSRIADAVVAEIEDSASQDGANKHQDEMVPVASDDVSSNNEAVSENENAIQEKATARRSCRNRIPPLAHWRNERKLFRYMADGDVVDLGVDPGTKEDRKMIEIMMMKKNRARRTKHTKTKQKRGHDDDVSGSKTDDTAEPAVLLDSVTGEQTEVLLHSRFYRQKWTIPTSQLGGKPAYRVCHSLWNEKMSFGFVEISAGCKKGEQYSPDSGLHFVVQQGNLVFHIKDNIYKLGKNDSISVPVATPYSIDNCGKTKALLHFCSTTLPLF